MNAFSIIVFATEWVNTYGNCTQSGRIVVTMENKIVVFSFRTTGGENQYEYAALELLSKEGLITWDGVKSPHFVYREHGIAYFRTSVTVARKCDLL